MTPPGAGAGENSRINPDLWHACAGPLVDLPPVGSLVVYFPQGHSEQVAASMQKDVDTGIPNYPNLPSKLICLLHNVTLHADAETDEVYAQMILQPVNSYDTEALQASELAQKSNRSQPEFFCKTLTASDTSTHGGFSVPRRAAEKIFPPLDFSMQPPAQELQAKDLHDNIWTFRHIYRGQPKRHLLTTGWSLFVSGKRLFTGDSVLFVRDDKSQLLLGIRRANRQPPNMSLSVLSSHSMHIGILAAAANAAANNSQFTVFYNPRASPSEFVIPLGKYNKAIYSSQISLGMRFRMMFETEESGTRRYMGTITGISDLDPVKWKNSQWRNLQVGWDEAAAGERRNRVSIWEIEPVAAPFFICPPPLFRSKRSRQAGMQDDDSSDMGNLFKRAMPWLGDEICFKDSQSHNDILSGLSLVQWMNMQQNPSLTNSSMQADYLRSLAAPSLPNPSASDISRQLGLQAQILQQNNIQCNGERPYQQTQQFSQLPKVPDPCSQLSNNSMPQELQDITLHQRQLLNQSCSSGPSQNLVPQTQSIPPSLIDQQQSLNHNFQPPTQTNLPQNQMLQSFLQQQQPQLQLQQQQLQISQQQSSALPQTSHQGNQLELPEQHMQMQLLQKLRQQQARFLQQPQQFQEHQKMIPEPLRQLKNSSSLPLQHSIPQQVSKGVSMAMQFSLPFQKEAQQFSQKQIVMPSEVPSVILQSQAMNVPTTSRSCTPTLAGVQRSPTIDNLGSLPPCSISPTIDNRTTDSQVVMNKTFSTPATNELSQAMPLLSSATFDVVQANPNLGPDFLNSENIVKPKVFIPKTQVPSNITSQAYPGSTAHVDQMEPSSSANSACLSQLEGQFPPTSFPLSPFNQSFMFKDTAVVDDIQVVDPGDNLLGVHIKNQLDMPTPVDPLLVKDFNLGKDGQMNLSSGGILANYNSSKEAQQEMSSSIVSQSFGVPDVFNSIDSNINDSNFLNNWATTQELPKIRTYTKVYKRGAVGRSIDVTRYSGYEELKQDLARMFSIEGQIEERHRQGWKLVYVDHENDVLLVGDDPWEEFVNCVRCIRILSQHEVQQMSLEGNLGNTNANQTQTCSSSDGGNTWQVQYDHNSDNPSIGCYDHF